MTLTQQAIIKQPSTNIFYHKIGLPAWGGKGCIPMKVMC